MTTKTIQNTIAKTVTDFITLRRHIHRHPELGFEEYDTSDLVAQKLTEWGYEVHRGLGKTGVVGTLKVSNGPLRLGLRADMDALPILEDNGKDWASTTPHKFHGCGHDGHTAILLAAAHYLANTRQFNGTLHVIFQPAEELLYGAREMINDGLFDLFPCDMIYGLHNMPTLPTGRFYFRSGAMMASSDTLEIHIHGTGGHGALPEHTVDSTVVACHIVLALQNIVARNVSPFEQAVVTVGSIQSGQAANVINAHAKLKLSVRALSADVRQLLLRRIEEIATSQAQSFNATAQVIHVNGSPVLINDDKAVALGVALAQELFGDEMVESHANALMGSEDFAFMLEEHPHGAYFFVGNGDAPGACMVHNPGYDFNDDIILPAATFWAALTQRYLR